MPAKPFVKSADTSTAAINSRSQLDKMLRRYGATAISMADDIEQGRIVVTFIVPDSTQKNAQRVPVKLPISVRDVYHALYGRTGRYDAKRYAQAERVAWRNLVLWVDAALSATSVGLQTITEAFFAHAVVGEGGERMFEVVEAYQSTLGHGVQRLLTAPAEEL